MDNIIKDILAADKLAQEKVSEAQDVKANIGESVKKEKTAILKKYEQASKKEIEAALNAINLELESLQKQSDKELEKTVASLQRYYEENKDTWIDYMLKACIES
ncbi:MAG: hypothetical protein RSG07_05350 [Erysipelotrichaceae bacterium]